MKKKKSCKHGGILSKLCWLRWCLPPWQKNAGLRCAPSVQWCVHNYPKTAPFLSDFEPVWEGLFGSLRRHFRNEGPTGGSVFRVVQQCSIELFFEELGFCPTTKKREEIHWKNEIYFSSNQRSKKKAENNDCHSPSTVWHLSVTKQTWSAWLR